MGNREWMWMLAGSHAALDARNPWRETGTLMEPRVKPEDDKKRDVTTDCLYIIRKAAFSRQPLVFTIKEQVL